ncbi:MAG: MT-A70 family methyltransferase [Endomicrobiaceae bacterium]|nr:MT-A70 family methyltransferase [Endomicrobiaceae bacterium]
MFVDIFNTPHKYNIIYADPPWKYNARNNQNTRFGGGAAGHYPVMSYKDIAALPIGNIAADNCALFLWVTFPHLLEQIQIFESWGFTYRTLGFSWIKTNPKNGKPFFGIGYYSKSNCEVCLLGVRGKMVPVNNLVSSCVISPRREHSRKPDEVGERIVTMFGDIPRIELFARKHTDGWDCWGNEVNITED